MSTVDAVAARSPHAAGSLLDRKMQRSSPGRWGLIVFATVLVAGFGYAGVQLGHDLSEVGHISSYWPYVLLWIALLVALGFEFVNGFHDTANAVATVIYTHSLKPHVAVVWSGMWNFIGVLFSSGAVAFGIISLLPVELILHVGIERRVRDGLCAADVGHHLESGHLVLRASASSSHTLIGSIIGVGLANQLMSVQHRHEWRRLDAGPQYRQLPAGLAAGGVHVAGATAAVAELVVKDKRLFEAPKDGAAAVLDPRSVAPDLHRRQLRARVE